jgi:flagellar basal body-associated protein FliL
MKKMIIKKLYVLLFCFATATTIAQQKPLQTGIDSTKIKIGSQAKLTLRATVDTAAKVSFPTGKNFGQLEVINSYPVDTIRKGAIYELVKKYGLTQFDSGRYVIPRLPVVINNKTIQTDSLALEVYNIKVDTLKQKMFDIKPVVEAKSSNNWIYILLGILLLAGTGFGIWWYLKKVRKPREKAAPAVIKSPIEIATAQLQDLEKKELLQRGAVKEYYSEMADIARTYIEEAIHIPAMESTTGELIEAMHNAVQRKKMSLRPETFEQLEQVLRNADLVKFAKSKPLDFEIAEDRTRIEKTIVVIDRSIPEETPEDDSHTQLWLEAQRKKKEKKRRNIIIASSIGIVVALLILLGFTVGMDYLRDNYIGHNTKELAEGEWVRSEYGNPGVTVETPRVLKRINVEATVPKETMALLKEMSTFGYGSLTENFYVEVATLTYKQETEVDLNAVLDGAAKLWEARGASNILLKTEEFATEKGISGMRSYGNMTLPDPITKTPVRAYYELYVFKQQGGLQQVMVQFREGDQYGTQILERIKNSIELKTQNPQ